MRRWLGGSLVVGSVLLAACGGGGGDTDPVPPPTGTPTPRPTPTPTPSPAPSPSPSPAPVGAPPVGAALNEATCALQYAYANPTTLSGADPRLGEQWHLVNTGQSGGTAGEDLDVLPVWSQTAGTGTPKGEGVRIAVVDDSLEVTHQDLVANVPAGQSFNYRSAKRGNAFPLPCLVDDDHGTAVGGIIAARDGNAVGVAGVAPRSAIVGYNALATGTDADIADALTRALDANQIYHNSWGSSDNGIANPAERTFIDAIEHGIANGRQGKGSVYVFSAGNGGCYAQSINDLCLFDDNSNFDGYVNKKGVIAVCAVDDRGRSPFYAEPGANVLVCAPSGGATSGITTTYVLDAYRPGPNNDPGAFSGTSASAPMVSGVVALMLAANPALTWRDVRLLLARSARRNDPSSAGWVTHVGDGVTYHHHPYYGFGAVDAQAAVTLATTWSTIGGSSSLVGCEKPAWTRTLDVALPDAPTSGAPTTVSDSVTVADADCAIRKIEFVEVTLKTTHAYTGDLRVRLVSPNGLVSELAVDRQCGSAETDACGPFDDWAFGSVRHLDESTLGAWRLEVTDAANSDTGTWNRWSIRFWGRP